MNYLEFTFEVEPVQPATEILIAELGQAGFESFVENENGVTAYIPEEEFEEESLSGVQILQSDEFSITYTRKQIEQVNWNEEWEKNFHPIMVDDSCCVRAPFHSPPDVEYDIIIEPKMSFGTGHHATTHMMIQFLLKNNFEGKKVLDMGCGTGVLAIVAEKRGAAEVDAIDIDNWCYQNSLENVQRNNCSRISVHEGGAELLGEKKYEVIIANINRNILLEDIKIYSRCLDSKGELYLSGFYGKDIPLIMEECERNGLEKIEELERDEWVALHLRMKN